MQAGYKQWRQRKMSTQKVWDQTQYCRLQTPASWIPILCLSLQVYALIWSEITIPVHIVLL